MTEAHLLRSSASSVCCVVCDLAACVEMKRRVALKEEGSELYTNI